mmetsp:Transcript_23299/g.34363  ORF Transcript_23299/g.34363 Transcript_23299/m.34363 type:complete len:90 (-) Transcript_23299:166-435(-)
MPFMEKKELQSCYRFLIVFHWLVQFLGGCWCGAICLDSGWRIKECMWANMNASIKKIEREKDGTPSNARDERNHRVHHKRRISILLGLG